MLLLVAGLLVQNVTFAQAASKCSKIISMRHNLLLLDSVSVSRHGVSGNAVSENYCNARKTSGILTTFAKEKGLLIDFQSAEICTLSEVQLEECKNSAGFMEVKSKFSGSELFICINIGWKDYFFKFDMDYQGTFIMKKHSRLKFQYLPHERYEVLDIHDLTASESSYYKHRSVRLNNINYNTAIWLNESQNQSVGVGFLKGFNWIIDFKNKTVRAQKNAVSIDIEDFSAKDYTARAIGNMLCVTSRNLRGDKFNVGDRISAIEGIELNPRNICDFEILLRQTERWDKLKIEIGQR